MPASSTASARVFVPRIDYSRLELSIWLIQHCVPSSALILAEVALYVKCVGFGLIILCAWYCRPRRCTRFSVTASDDWAVPDEALHNLRMLDGTRFTQWWVRLELGKPGGTHRSLCVWRDMLDSSDWRQLQIWLNEHRRVDR